MKKSDGEIHEKTASWGILQSEWLKNVDGYYCCYFTASLSDGLFSVARHDCGRDIFVRRLIISSHNICTDYRNH